MNIRILSLDGGGSWAVLQAMALNNIYTEAFKRTPDCREILNDFNLVAANSGGSLLLAAMIEHADQPMQVVIDLFMNEANRKAIFSAIKPFERNYAWTVLQKVLGIGPKYKARHKKEALLHALPHCGHLSLARAKQSKSITPRLLICGFDYDMQRAVFFKSDHDADYTLADAVNASSNAPVNYFDEPVVLNYDSQVHRFWDGAVGGNNNPLLVALAEARDIYRHIRFEHTQVHALSLGTGNTLLPVQGFTASDESMHEWLIRKQQQPSLIKDLPVMARAVLSEPPEAATYMAHIFLDGKNEPGAEPALVRMSPMISPRLSDKQWVLPVKNSEAIFKRLTSIDMDAVKQEEMNDIFTLGQWWLSDLVPNQGIRYNGRTFETTIGHPCFSAAKKDWLRKRLNETDLMAA